MRWTGTVDFAALPEPGKYRVLITEYEYLSANYVKTTQVGRRSSTASNPERLIYAETIEIDTALIGGPSGPTGTVLED